MVIVIAAVLSEDLEEMDKSERKKMSLLIQHYLTLQILQIL